MGVAQVNASFQNDGNFSQLDLRNVEANGPVMRIETFRCSQPEGEFGKTIAGTSVKSIAGLDHLSKTSNRTFRHFFSTGELKSLKVTLEIREEFEEDGSFEIRTRDVDGVSSTYGSVLINRNRATSNGVKVSYELRRPPSVSKRTITSPVDSKITDQAKELVDLSSSPDSLGQIVNTGGGYNEFSGDFVSDGDNRKATENLDVYAKRIREICPDFMRNVKVYERMGDFRDKCIHPGVNLVGTNPQLASEFMPIRAYRMSLITLARIFDDEMCAGADKINMRNVMELDTKPGVYSIFLQAYALNIGIYQLGIDKVHSDYGGIPMKLKPGSRMENGTEPIVDATNLNRMLAFIAALYFVPTAKGQVTSISPSITSFNIRETMSFMR